MALSLQFYVVSGDGFDGSQVVGHGAENPISRIGFIRPG